MNEDPSRLTPGSDIARMIGQGIFGFAPVMGEWGPKMPASSPIRKTAEAQNEGTLSPWGPKMPEKARQKADAAIGKVITTKEDEGKFPWKEIFVYSGLAILFLIGVVSLLQASGITPSPVKTIIKKVGGK